MKDEPLLVTKPLMPPLEEFLPYLEQIWESGFVTNGGQMHQRLERALAEYLGVEYVVLFANGTLALLAALKALDIRGEVITTPYSFVATSHAIVWSGLTPVFSDIDPVTLNLDAAAIESAITERTCAILPVHCYGRPCDVDAIKALADKYGLAVVYDAAHAFGVEDDKGSLLRHGDLSVLSFHATKVFQTFEGGAVVCATEKQRDMLNQLKNFGFVDELTVHMPGINAKMNEISAAFGLLQLRYVKEAIDRRRFIYAFYEKALASIPGIVSPGLPQVARANYSYYPILVGDGFPLSRDELYERFRAQGIMVRRYFYPLISNFSVYEPYARHALPVAQWASARVICLPIYPELKESDLDRVVGVVVGCL